MDLVELKAAVQREIDATASLLIETSDWMADNPEIGLSEFQASARLTEILSEFGAAVERGIAGMPTAFEAKLPGGRSGPKVAIVAEYDALPEVGHGCGHNIIATAAIGAGLALARLGQYLPGSVVVLGTPAEESTVPNAGGKIPILDHGYFDGMDAAIMIHPLTEDAMSEESSLVAHGLDIRFHGHPAHAAVNPHEGINALDALIVMFSSVGLLRQQVRSDARIHGIITHGGTAPNVIPAYTACRFRVRAADPAYARELVDRVIACAEAGARATGARMEWNEYMPPYLNMVPNSELNAAFLRNLEALGRPMQTRQGGDAAGSTDFGNVSHRVPATCAYLAICGPEAGWHTREVAEATRTDRGHAAIVDGAKSIAMTALDVLFDAALREQAHAEHREAMAELAV
ncbi:MAG TPA: M20 family metallopeptidase [Roseiflexaceae bacterium]|nr:M20 family metallopeptidase [Roseiflexaceae bacterium]